MNDRTKLLTISLSDYLMLNDKKGSDFIAVGVESSDRRSLGWLPSVGSLEDKVCDKFLENLPPKHSCRSFCSENSRRKTIRPFSSWISVRLLQRNCFGEEKTTIKGCIIRYGE